jgi:hypothetical protein
MSKSARHGAPDEAADPIEVAQWLTYQSFARLQRGKKGGFDHPLVQVELQLAAEPDQHLGAHCLERGEDRKSETD